MLFFLSGTDHFRIRLRERALARDFSVAHPGTTETVFDGRDEVAGIVSKLQEALAGGLFVTPRVVLIRHVELFDEKLCAAVIALLSQTLPKEVLVVTSAEPAGRAKKGNTLQVWLTQEAKNETVNVLTGRPLAQSITDILHDIDPVATIAPQAAELLGTRTAGATGHIYHSLLKLSLVATGRSITEADVLDLTGEPVGESLSFVLLDTLVRGERERALALLRREETGADAVFKLIGLFAWQVRQALMVRDEYERGVTSPDAIAATVGAKPFSVRKLMPLMRTLSLARLKRALALLAELDHGIKTGQMRPGVALDLFVWKF